MKSSMRDEVADPKTQTHSVDAEKGLSDVESPTPEKGHGVYAQQEEDVPWTFTRVLAIASLCMVYVGESLDPLYVRRLDIESWVTRQACYETSA